MKNCWLLWEKYSDYSFLTLSEFIKLRSVYFHKTNGLFLDSAILEKSGVIYTFVDKKNFLANKLWFFNKIKTRPRWFTNLLKNETKQFNKTKNEISALLKIKRLEPTALEKTHADFMKIAMIGQPFNILEFDQPWLSSYARKNKNSILLKICESAMRSKKERYRLLLDYISMLKRAARQTAKYYKTSQKAVERFSFPELMFAMKMKSPVIQKNAIFGEIYSRGKTQKITPKQIQAILENEKTRTMPKNNILMGQTAYPGKAAGKVCIIHGKKDIKKFLKGRILVCHTTHNEIMPCVHKSSAIITDMGGITSHGAIIAREIKKPCIIGTKIATKIFKDGDMVEVDANKGIVKKLN